MFSEFCGLSRQSRLRGQSCSSHFISQTRPIYCCCVFVFILVVRVRVIWCHKWMLMWVSSFNKQRAVHHLSACRKVYFKEETVWPWVTPATPSALRIGWGNCISELTHTFIFCSCFLFLFFFFIFYTGHCTVILCCNFFHSFCNRLAFHWSVKIKKQTHKHLQWQ